MKDVVRKVERHNFAVAAWSGNLDLCLAVSRRWRGTEVAGRRVDERTSKGRWGNDGGGWRMKWWR